MELILPRRPTRQYEFAGDSFEHLSYFEQYGNTDPGTTFNEDARTAFVQWFNNELTDDVTILNNED